MIPSKNCEFVCTSENKDEWLRARTKGIGSSDCASVLGESPWKTQNQLWLEKTGRVKPDDLSGNPAVQWGIHLEEPIAQKYAEETGFEISGLKSGLFRSAKHPFMLASPDRLVAGMKRGVEIKNVGWRQGQNWTPNGEARNELCVPSHYRLQVAHQMAVLDYDVWDLCVLIGGQDFRIYELHRDKELEEMLIEREEVFWKENVRKNVAPPPCEEANAYQDFLKKNHAKHDDRMLTANDDAVNAQLRLLQEARQRVAVAKRELTAAQNSVCEVIGDALGIQFVDPKDGKIVWKARQHKHWKDIAVESGATPEVITKHTVMGSRELRAYGKFFKIEGGEEDNAE